MKILRLFLLLFGLSNCYSCITKVDTILDLKEIMIDPDNTKPFSDLTYLFNDSIDVIPLETTDDCLVSKIQRIKIHDDNIFISDISNSKIFMFNSEGKFLRTIGKQGIAPGEYAYLGDFSFKEDSIVVQDVYGKKYIIYDLYKGSFREISYDIHHFEMISFGDIAYFVSNYSKSKYGYYNLFKFDMNASKILSLDIPFKKKESEYMSSYGLNRYASICDTTAVLIYPLNDTIYTVNRNSSYPSYLIYFTSCNLPIDLNLRKKGLYRYIHQNRYLKGWEYIQNSNDYLFGYYVDRNSFKYVVYNKHTGDCDVADRLRISALGNLSIHSFYTTADNNFLCFLSADELATNWKSLRKNCDNHYKEKLDNLVSSLDEDSNPVLFKFSFKK